jgi:GNAT superfamily N-acetyltransferase
VNGIVDNPAVIRGLLADDRWWAAYALGDLAPDQFRHCIWLRNGNGLVLLYRGFSPPVLFAHATAGDFRGLLAELAREPQVLLHVRPEITELLRTKYTRVEARPMWRMRLRRLVAPAPVAEVLRLSAADLGALEELYSDGKASGEEPDFFFAHMLEDGVFHGIRSGGRLLAAAGTHIVARDEGVAAVGNVYTRRDARGRGCGALVTWAVSDELARMGIPVIVLNVRQDHPHARRAYEKVGFERYCAYHEGRAWR